MLKAEAEKKVTDLQMKHAESRFPVSYFSQKPSKIFCPNNNLCLGFTTTNERRLHVP